MEAPSPKSNPSAPSHNSPTVPAAPCAVLAFSLTFPISRYLRQLGKAHDPSTVTAMLHAAPPCRTVLGGEGGLGGSPAPCCCLANAIPTLLHLSCLPDLLWEVFLPFQEMEKGYSNNLSDGEWGGKAERLAFSLQRMHVFNSAGEENSTPGPQRQSLGMS